MRAFSYIRGPIGSCLDLSIAFDILCCVESISSAAISEAQAEIPSNHNNAVKMQL